MSWPEAVHASEVQSRLLQEGVPVERAMQMTSELRNVPPGGTYRVELAGGSAVLLHATIVREWFAVSRE